MVRAHKNIAPLTAALGANAGVGAATADSIFARADAATDASSTGSLSRRGSGSGSGSGGLVVRSHRNVASLSSQVIAMCVCTVPPFLFSLGNPTKPKVARAQLPSVLRNSCTAVAFPC